MTAKINLSNVAVILVEPQIPENIGSVARAMCNMGLARLVLINPKNCDLSRVLKTATGCSVDLVQDMRIHHDLLEGIGPYQHVVGTTARIGSLRPAMTRPRRLARELVSISQNNKVAILFGPEDRGLSNEHLKYCHSIASIPTAGFPSLNLAHAVLIFGYEIFLTALPEGLEAPRPRLASRFELEGMYDHLKEALLKIGFIDPQNPEHWMLNIRRFLSRLPLRAREVRVIRGVCRQMDWYTEQFKRKYSDDD